ncbi:MAG: hypothetical protein LBC02_15100 [Planctomycetaceae bacterium]|nr:hypothetical protein [Planctomycetaceae bacterium]
MSIITPLVRNNHEIIEVLENTDILYYDSFILISLSKWSSVPMNDQIASKSTI